ncbi:MAG: FHA domain-containing protein [Kiritimatiellae bacterium]|jgi:pSer/pThr/pTyr-binding forkhead associated (FHA) protein|nr:FHA domain-containing protein [Kiritimatiellia bacterium]
MPIIEILNGEEIGRTYEWGSDNGIRVGRNSANDFVIANASVSGEHCIIEPCDGGWRIKDNDSTNGTRLNDQRITMAMLHRNDVIAFGDIVASIRGDDMPESKPSFDNVDSIPRTTIVMRPRNAASTSTADGFSKKSESKKLFNAIITISVIAIIALIAALAYKLLG